MTKKLKDLCLADKIAIVRYFKQMSVQNNDLDQWFLSSIFSSNIYFQLAFFNWLIACWLRSYIRLSFEVFTLGKTLDFLDQGAVGQNRCKKRVVQQIKNMSWAQLNKVKKSVCYIAQPSSCITCDNVLVISYLYPIIMTSQQSLL